LESIIAQLEQDTEIRVVFLAGAGERAFCVGADINDWSSLRPVDMWQHIRDGHRVFRRLAKLPQPVIALLQGYVLGGGLELALAADIRLATEDTKLALPEVKIGTTPGWGATERLPLLIGPARAKQMILSGAQIDVGLAEQWGLVNEVLADDRLMPRSLELAGEIAANAPLAVQLAKQIIDGNVEGMAGMSQDALAGMMLSYTDDGREGATSFRERRPPIYKRH
jgi:enoyl-CoA hydratase/carnithine racemase